jgi:L-ascorbate metabolism protein UlaG (beta-lactamase superfamily)
MEIKGLNINFLGHSGFFIKSSKNIVIDPYNISGNPEKADIILITHSHYDHCSIKDIEKFVKDGTMVISSPDCQSKLTKIENINMQVIEVGDKINIGGIKIEAVSAYNLNKDFHPKEEGWLGFVVKLKDIIIYHAGDTDFIPEIKNLSGYGKHENEFIVFLPVSGKFVMDPEEAAEAASYLKPNLVIPMHYGEGVAGTIEDAERFSEICNEKNINVKILEKI